MIRLFLAIGFAVVVSLALAAQGPEPPLADTRLTVHTLLREDIFAGLLQGDLVRLARAEKNIERLLASRPGERASVLAWQGSTALTRAVLGHEGGQAGEFRRQYQRALDLFAEAGRLGPEVAGVFAIIGGTQVTLADRLPAAERGAGWEQAYSSYQQLWTMQGAVIEKLPLHHKGEVLAGLAQSAQRTGRDAEVDTQIERILTLLPGTPYATRARGWKDDPATRAQATLTCQTCHAAGTLAARVTELSKTK